MDHDGFRKHVEDQLSYCREILENKAIDYATDSDRLNNFKKGANLSGKTPTEVCTGLMLKQIVAIYDYTQKNEKSYKKWEEKITDTINYLLLLNAILIEREDII